MSTPTLVQHVQFHSNEQFEAGNNFVFPLPNATLANNCIVLFFSMQRASTRTYTITDSAGNTWPTTPTVVTNDTTNLVTTACFVLPNAAAGVVWIKVVFNATVKGMHLSFSEWCNVATSSPMDGSHGANLITGTIASGSFTTTTNGDLILHYGEDTNFGTAYRDGEDSGNTGITKASGYTVLQADWAYASFLEYQVQATAGATNPGVTFSGGTMATSSFNSLTIALKAASAGTAPSATAPRVLGIFHTDVVTSGTANHTFWAPLFGSAAICATSYIPNECKINSCSGSQSGAWTVISPAGFPQAAYKTGLANSAMDVLTVNATNGSANKLQVCIYDMVNTGAFDTHTTASSGSTGAGATIAHLPDITPGVANGITIFTVTFDTGPPSAMPLPSGGGMDTVTFTGYTDLDPMDTGDGWGHYYFSSNALQACSWTDSAATAGSFATAYTFAAATSTQSFSYTGSGGLSLAGSGTELRASIPAPSGGITFAGTSAEVRKVSPAPSSGLSFSGSGPRSFVRPYTASGGLALAGAAARSRALNPHPSGGLVFAGAATESSSNQQFSYTGAGGIVFAGSASATYHVAKITVTMAGGITFSGVATVGYTNTGEAVASPWAATDISIGGAHLFRVAHA